MSDEIINVVYTDPELVKTGQRIMAERKAHSLHPAGCASAQCDIQHGDACPECGGCVRWTESQLFSGCCLECDECGETFWPRHNVVREPSRTHDTQQPET